ncbi:MAG: twin-arginine translocase TatA/TatE family subunit [Myxococcota bacterium]|nr:twin-arginine translocase TatA/TatE family subunit [Myxococcota bacterium]
MLPFGIGIPEVLVILVVVLLVVGPQKLPELARTLGKGLRGAQRAGQELRNAMDVSEPMRQAREDWRREFQFDEDQYEHDDAHVAHGEAPSEQPEQVGRPDAASEDEGSADVAGLPHTVSRGDSIGSVAAFSNSSANEGGEPDDGPESGSIEETSRG